MAGVQRRINAIERGLPAKHGADDRPENNWQIDIMGTLSEYAVSKAFRMHWNAAIVDTSLADLEGDVEKFQVRSTGYMNGHLIIYEYDKPEAPYILAIVREPWVKLCGWMTLPEARHLVKPQPSKTHDCFWIPQHLLHDMNDLGTIYYDDYVKHKDNVCQ